MTRDRLLEMDTLLDRLHILPDEAARTEFVLRLRSHHGPVIVGFLNQHGFNLAYESAEFRRRLAGSTFLLRDGVGIEVILRLLGRTAGVNANGTDLIPTIIAESRGRPVAVFGTTRPWLESAVRRMSDAGANVVSAQDGFQPDAAYLAEVRSSTPDTVLLGMGMPRQEALAERLRALEAPPRLIINGGAILDFYAGRFPRAPRWIRSARMEWAFRLAQEPRRLSKRYVVGGAIFVWRVVLLLATRPFLRNTR